MARHVPNWDALDEMTSSANFATMAVPETIAATPGVSANSGGARKKHVKATSYVGPIQEVKPREKRLQAVNFEKGGSDFRLWCC